MVAFNTHTAQGHKAAGALSLIFEQFWALFSFACKAVITEFQTTFGLIPPMCQACHAGKIAAQFCAEEILPCFFYMSFNCDA